VPDVNPLKDTLTSIVWAVVSRITVVCPALVEDAIKQFAAAVVSSRKGRR